MDWISIKLCTLNSLYKKTSVFFSDIMFSVDSNVFLKNSLFNVWFISGKFVQNINRHGCNRILGLEIEPFHEYVIWIDYTLFYESVLVREVFSIHCWYLIVVDITVHLHFTDTCLIRAHGIKRCWVISPRRIGYFPPLLGL